MIKIFEFVFCNIAGGMFLWMFNLLSKKDNNIEKYKTKAIIEKVIYSDVGNVKYYIKFNKDNEEMRGQTIYYSKTNHKYHEGDSAEIYYHYTKNNKIRAEIIDDDLVTVSSTIKYSRYVLLLLAIFFFVASIVSLF